MSFPPARIVWFVVPLLTVAGVLVALLRWASGPSADGASEPEYTLLDKPPVGPPTAVSAAESDIPGTAVVIGVSAGGRHRAYLLDILAPVDAHVLNDLVGDCPVTVSYCDKSEKVAVFTGPATGRPLEVAVGGWVGRGPAGCLLLRDGTTRYRQDTGMAVLSDPDARLPYQRLQFELTSWGAWRAAHPDTDVVGKPHM